MRKSLLDFQFERDLGKKELVVLICYMEVLIVLLILIVRLNIVSDQNRFFLCDFFSVKLNCRLLFICSSIVILQNIAKTAY